ncbi:MAG: preprotein translocase subunit SecE [Bacteroidota bacterium]
MKKLSIFTIESIKELQHKVTWPAYKELQSSSTLVLIASFILAVAIGLIDIAFRNIIGWFYNAL